MHNTKERNETNRQFMLAQCDEVDRLQAAYMEAHPECPRYCYTCQDWLKNADAMLAHIGHEVH